jgi:hypothetical protein
MKTTTRTFLVTPKDGKFFPPKRRLSEKRRQRGSRRRYQVCLRNLHQLTLCPVQKAAARKQRIDKLVEALERKLSIFTESANGPDDPQVTASWRAICYLEAQYAIYYYSRFCLFRCLIRIQGIKDRELWGRPVACTAVLYCRLPPYSPFVPKAIGFVYVAKAKHHLATHQTFLGVGGWLHNVQGKYHVFSETYAPHAHQSPFGTHFRYEGSQPYGPRWN